MRRRHRRRLPDRLDQQLLLRLAALGLGFTLPVLTLFALNLRQTALTETVSGTRSLWKVGDAETARPLFLVVSALGAPGLGLFQSDMWITHLAYFSDAHLSWLRGWDETERLALKALLGISGTAALAWALDRRRRQSGALAGFVILLVAGFYLELTVVSALVGYNYLAREPRLVAGIIPLAQAIMLAEWLRERRDSPASRMWFARLPALALFVVLPTAFAAANFVKNDLYDRHALRYTTSPTGLFMPEISLSDVSAVRAVVAGALRSPRDVVVLAGAVGWGGYSAFVPWLEFPQRTFPVGPFYAPLGTRYLDTADLRGGGTFVTAHPLRLVLVLARSLTKDGTLARLQARVPQARSWTVAPMPPGAEVAVYFSDLAVR